ncbi:hypothetical protein EON66_10265, partial [archaeon]
DGHTVAAPERTTALRNNVWADVSTLSGDCADRVDSVDASNLDRRVYVTPKVIFVSRTHSQLTQFISELRKTTFFTSTRVVALGSRKALCVNPAVQQLGSDTRINERCMELLDKRRATILVDNVPAAAGAGDESGPPSAREAHEALLTAHSDTAGGTKRQRVETTGGTSRGSTACPYYGGLESLASLRDMILSEPRDIEDIAAVGVDAHKCAYFATRAAVPLADVIIMPYSLLLSETARNACGVDLHGSLLIVDEAHNLVDAINSTASTSVTAAQLDATARAVDAYLQRYASRLSATNSVMLSQLLAVLRGLAGALEPAHTTPRTTASQQAAERMLGADARVAASATVAAAVAGHASAPLIHTERVMTPLALLHSAGIDNINLFQLLARMESTHLLRKLRGFLDATRGASACVAGTDCTPQVAVHGRVPTPLLSESGAAAT